MLPQTIDQVESPESIKSQSPLAPDHLVRLAHLVARGESPIPTDLEPDALREVLEEVARQRRARLIHYIARVIAWDIYREQEPRKEPPIHAEERI